MAHYTGIADLDALLVQLATDLAAAGWTIHANTTMTDGRWLAASPPTETFVFIWRSDSGTDSDQEPASHLYCLGATSFDSEAAGWSGQPGTPTDFNDAHSAGWTGVILDADLIITSTYCHIVARSSAGEDDQWRHCLAGKLDGLDAGTDAWYFGHDRANHINLNQQQLGRLWKQSTSLNASAVYADGVWSWFRLSGGRRARGGVASGDLLAGPFAAGRSMFSGVAPLLPVVVCQETAVASGIYRPVGTVPDHRIFNFTGQTAGTLTVGTESWLVAPGIRVGSGATADVPRSGADGYAYKTS